MVTVARMLARRSVFLGVAVIALFLAISAFAGLGRAEQLVASWYGVGDGFAGLTTANGETFDPYEYTAAHKTLPFGTKLAVSYEGRTAVVRINDRGPYIEGRDLDLSYAAADYIGLTAAGSAPVNVEYVDASTPVGPSQSSAPEPAPETGPVEPEQEVGSSALQSPSGSAGDEQYAPSEEQYEEENGGEQEREATTRDRQAAADQYDEAEPDAGDDQYADGEQYEDGQNDGRSGPPPAPDPLSPQQAPEQPSPATVAPEVSELEEPPAELVKPGSTVERRVETEVAAAPGTATDSPDTPDLAPVPDDQYADPGDETNDGSPAPPSSPKPMRLEIPARRETPTRSGTLPRREIPTRRRTPPILRTMPKSRAPGNWR